MRSRGALRGDLPATVTASLIRLGSCAESWVSCVPYIHNTRTETLVIGVATTRAGPT